MRKILGLLAISRCSKNNSNLVNWRSLSVGAVMAQSKFEYTRKFESDDRLLPNAWIVIRIDGKAFHKFSEAHNFEKPNCKPALDLMNKCASSVIKEFNEIVLAYGQSDEFSFVFRPDTGIYSRRGSKLITNISSLFSSSYVFHWKEFFPTQELLYPPSFDGRAVLYPSIRNMRDYLSWRQADCHINNLYNTVFWALVLQGQLSPKDAEKKLSGTLAGDKNEILFSEFGINYNNEPLQFRKGTTIIKKKMEISSEEGESKLRSKPVFLDCDIIGDEFWEENCYLIEKFR